MCGPPEQQADGREGEAEPGRHEEDQVVALGEARSGSSRRLCVLAAVASTARPIDPPTWLAVFASPPTIPASPAGTSAVAAAIRVGKVSPIPTAISSVGPSRPVT